MQRKEIIAQRLHHTPALLFGTAALLFAMLVGVGCTPLIHPPQTVHEDEAQIIVQIHYPSVEVLNQLASTLDIWEVDRNAQTLVAKITLAQYGSLLAQQLPTTLDCPKMRTYAQALRSERSITVQKLLQQQCPASS